MAPASRKRKICTADDKENSHERVVDKAGTVTVRKSKKLGRLAGLLDMPLDVLLEVYPLISLPAFHYF